MRPATSAMCRSLVVASLVAVAGLLAAAEAPDDGAALERRVAELEVRVAELERLLAPMHDRLEADARRQPLRERARARMQADRDRYTPEELARIEETYQRANRNLKAPEAVGLLEEVVATWPSSNRAGCALVYLGQIAEGDAGAAYLQRALAEHGDCFYGDGVQVGAYARFLLARRAREAGDVETAERLEREIRTAFADAVDHNGRPLVEVVGHAG